MPEEYPLFPCAREVHTHTHKHAGTHTHTHGALVSLLHPLTCRAVYASHLRVEAAHTSAKRTQKGTIILLIYLIFGWAAYHLSENVDLCSTATRFQAASSNRQAWSKGSGARRAPPNHAPVHTCSMIRLVLVSRLSFDLTCGQIMYKHVVYRLHCPRLSTPSRGVRLRQLHLDAGCEPDPTQ